MSNLDKKQQLKEIFKNPSYSYIIHYACTNLDSPQKRIISISIRCLSENSQTISFPNQNFIPKSYDEDFEREILLNFFNYVKNKKYTKFIHWNGRNDDFGIQAIENRFKELLPDVEIPFIKHENMYDLAEMLKNIYGQDYVVGHPRMKIIIEKNGLGMYNYLEGEQELEAFEKKQFKKIYDSVKCKVENIACIARLAYDGKLRTDCKQGRGVIGWIKRCFKKPDLYFLFMNIFK